jgi:hypothetical protein
MNRALELRKIKKFSTLFLIVSSILFLRVLLANRDFWQSRDDSVIHLSHALNLSLFGSVGLSPGDKTEAMSSPLNYLIGQIWFLINPNTSFESYLFVYTGIMILLFSAAYTHLLQVLIDSIKIKRANIRWFVFFIPLIFIVSSWTTFGWMISGMENAIGATVLLLITALSFKSEERKVNLLRVVIFLAGITRIEFFVLLFPFFIFAVTNIQAKNLQIKKTFSFFVPVLLGWIVFHGIRYIYFGQLTPNTAQAMGKNMSLALIIFLITQLILLFPLLGIRKIQNRLLDGFLALALGISGCSLLLENSKNGNFNSQVSILTSGTIILLTLFAKPLSKASIQQRYFLIALIAPLNEYFLFGPARLSEFRIVAIFVPLLCVLAIHVLITQIILKYGAPSLKFGFFILIGIAFSALAISKMDPERNLCCRISPSEKLIHEQSDAFLRNNGLKSSVMPISASPDLGKVSFAKKLMIVDLGLIGDPLLSKISNESPDDVSTYLLDYVAPDLFQTHSFWSCRYESFLDSVEFKAKYRIKFQGYVSEEFNGISQENCPEKGRYTIWVRDLPDYELRFFHKLNNARAENYPKIIRQEIIRCKESPLGNSRCQYVFRGIIREMRDIDRSEILTKIIKEIRKSPTAELDISRLQKDRNWTNKATSEFFLLIN